MHDPALSTAQHRELIEALALSHVLPHETLPVEECLGRRLAVDVSSLIPLPPFTNSAMDGFAVRREDLEGEGPWTLPVAGDIPAGDTRENRLERGQAWRIMTGAPIPAGAGTAGKAAGHRVDKILNRAALQEVEDPGGHGNQSATGVDLIHPAVIGEGEGKLPFSLMGFDPGASGLENVGEVQVVDQRPTVIDLVNETIQSAAEIDDGSFGAGVQVAPDLRHSGKVAQGVDGGGHLTHIHALDARADGGDHRDQTLGPGVPEAARPASHRTSPPQKWEEESLLNPRINHGPTLGDSTTDVDTDNQIH